MLVIVEVVVFDAVLVGSEAAEDKLLLVPVVVLLALFDALAVSDEAWEAAPAPAKPRGTPPFASDAAAKTSRKGQRARNNIISASHVGSFAPA